VLSRPESSNGWGDWNQRPTARTEAGVVVGISTTVSTSKTVLNNFLGVPFGGMKNSGVGREEGIEEMLSYTEAKIINVMLG